MSVAQSRTPRRGPVALSLVAFAVLAAAGCDAEADLIAYFGSPSPTQTAGVPTPAPTPTGSLSSAPSPSASASPSPNETVAPTAAPTTSHSATAAPAWPSLAPRPAGLAEFQVLRQEAQVTDVSLLARRPSDFVGDSVYFDGRVNEVVESGGSVRARVRVGQSVVLLVYRSDAYFGDHPLVQGDRIRVVGEFLGLTRDAEALPQIEPIDIVHRFA